MKDQWRMRLMSSLFEICIYPDKYSKYPTERTKKMELKKLKEELSFMRLKYD